MRCAPVFIAIIASTALLAVQAQPIEDALSEMKAELESEMLEVQEATEDMPDFAKMRVKKLQEYLELRGMDCAGCTEKTDYIERAKIAFTKPLLTPKVHDLSDAYYNDDELLELDMSGFANAPGFNREQSYAITQKFKGVSRQMKILMKTGLEIMGMDMPVICSACDASITEVQIQLQIRLQQDSGANNAKKWPRTWRGMKKDAKVKRVEKAFDVDAICVHRLKKYGFHNDTKMYVPATLRGRPVPGVDTGDRIAGKLMNICKFIDVNFRDKIVEYLANDHHRIERHITDDAKDVVKELPGLWVALKREICDEVMNGHGECMKTAAYHPFHKVPGFKEKYGGGQKSEL